MLLEKATLYALDNHEINPLQISYDFNLSLEQLAGIMGVSHNTVRSWSCGRRNPSNVSRQLAFTRYKQLEALSRKASKTCVHSTLL